MQSDDHIDLTFRRITRGLAFAALGVVLLVLAGWALDVRLFRQPMTSTGPMSPLTALAFGVLALAAALATLDAPIAATASRALAALGGGVGFVVLGANALGRPLPINAEVFGVTTEMAVATAGMVTLLGFALVIAGAGPVGRRVARLAVLCAGALGSGALVGYALGVGFFYGEDRTVQMAPLTAALGLLVVGAAAAVVRGPLQDMLLRRSLGGQFLRTTLPIVVAVQVLSGALATTGSRADLLAPATAVWVMTLSALVCLFVLIAHVALRLHAADLLHQEDSTRLNELARRDPLTGAYNRRAFSEEVERTLAHVHRYGGPGAVCVVDLDHFKEVNDTYGHQAGDEALVRIYRALRGRLRSTDVLGRLGGDEFSALLPRADELTAERVTAELAEVVDEVARELAAEGRPTRLGASVGCALMTEDRTAAELLDRADARMYAAKRAARAA